MKTSHRCVCVWAGEGGRGIICPYNYANVVGNLLYVHMSGPHTE